jgi:predicted transport protein
LENFGRKERVPVTEYTIEHIMPQDENLSVQWRQALGADWEKIHETWLHTLGNLTLTGYNSEYSNRFFVEKRDMEGGFKHSPLRLNAGLGEVETWNERTIQDRADRLADLALRVWGKPDLPDEILAEYKRKPEPKSSYSIADHQFLSPDAPMRPLFELFRAEVLKLDEVVTEEFLKLYVAYKAETNFVDVVPQASKLRVTLNMPFPDIYDPKGICRNVANLGRWGNGDVEFDLFSKDDLPYIMGLVRQAFERQMGNGDDD